MERNHLLGRTRFFILNALAWAKRPAVLWSSGKDSQVLLHLVRGFKKDVQVIHIERDQDPNKNAFARRFAAMNKIAPVKLQPVFRDLTARGDSVEVMEVYQVGSKALLAVPLEIESEIDLSRAWGCALERLNGECAEVKDAGIFPDLIFHGQRNDDVDAHQGAVPLKGKVATVGDVRMVYPLKDYSERDIWTVTRELKVPQNYQVYSRETGQRLPDPTWDSDKSNMCTRCLTPGLGLETVPCPKYGEAAYLGNSFDGEGQREFWRSQFVGIGKSA